MTLPWNDPQAILGFKNTVEAGLPYFGNVYQADQGSNHFKYFAPIVELVKRTKSDDEPLHILEIGSWAGASLIAWFNASNHQARLTAVDTWQPYLDSGNAYYDMMGAAAKTGKIFELFCHNVRVSGIGPYNLTIWQEESCMVLPKLAPGFDIVFIDGDHRYERVHADIANSLRLVRDGGVLCGDDLDKQLSEMSPDERSEHFVVLAQGGDAGVAKSGMSYHAGVTQAVNDYFGTVSCYGGRFWAVQKQSNAIGRPKNGWVNVSLGDI